MLFLIFSTLFNLSLANIPVVGCRMPRFGARAMFYEYPINDKESINNPDFLLSGYTKNIYLGVVDEVKNISWDSGWPAVVYPYGFKNLPITNFLVALTGFYRAPQTGLFSISLKADDFVALYVGKDTLKSYCNIQQYDFSADELVLSNNCLEPKTKSIYMEEGRYYAIKIVYVNYMERGVLSVDLIKPDGTVNAGLTENLYWMPPRTVGPNPAYFVTKYLTSTVSSLPDLTAPTTVSTSTTTHWVSSNEIPVDVIYFVEEPISTTTSTTTTDVSVSSTSTYMTPVTSSIGSSTTKDVSVPTTSSYTTLVTGSIGYSTTTDVSVPITSTYTTLVTGSFGSSSPQVFFNFDVEVEVRY